MPNVFYLRCRHCQKPLSNQKHPYCSACNTYLCYRALPILLGMLLTAPPAGVQSRPSQVPLYDADLIGYEAAEAICWE